MFIFEIIVHYFMMIFNLIKSYMRILTKILDKRDKKIYKTYFKL